MQEAINEQKKIMIERHKTEREAQKRAQDEFEKAIITGKDATNRTMEELNRRLMDLNNPEFRDAMKDLKNYGRMRFFEEPFAWKGRPGDLYYMYSNGNSEKSTWDISKSIKESSFSRDYIFDIESTAKSVVMSVSGDCKEGEIRVKITMPNGKKFSEIVIDEFGNLNWRKSLTISETENQDKTGEWKFDIKSSKATGYFKIFFQVS